LIYDYPTPRAVAEQLQTDILPEERAVRSPAIAELDQLESALSGIPLDSDMRDDITSRLQGILSRWIKSKQAEKSADIAAEFQSATPDEVFDFLDKEFGSQSASGGSYSG